MNKEKRRVPKLRFPGFTEDWEQRKLNEFLSVSNFKNIDNKYNKNDVLSVSGDYGIVNQIEFQGRSFAGVSVSNYGLVETGDIVYTKSPLKLNPYGIIKANRINAGIVSTLYAIYKTKKNCDSKFIEHYFNLDSRLNKYLKPLVNKGAKNDMKVSSENALIGEVCFPHVTEQKLIAVFLDRLDLFITLHQRKLEHLNLKKKALLQKLFPKNGARYPELRFPGFTDAWEQRKLGNLYKRVNERNDGTLGRDKWISVAKMYFQDPDKVQSNNLDTRTYVMKKGDIAFEGHPNNEFKFGRFVLNDIGTGIISELFPIYRPITEYDLDFWKYAIQLERVMAPIFAKSITSSGNSSNKLDHNHFLNQELLVPNIDEQKKIGTLLSILSKNITLHQRKLEHLQLQKKALLQQMFV